MVELMQTADLQLANFHTGTATYQSLNLLFCFLAVCALAYAEEVLNDATRCCEGWNCGSPEVSTVLGRGQDFSLILLPCWNDSLAAPTCLDFFFNPVVKISTICSGLPSFVSKLWRHCPKYLRRNLQFMLHSGELFKNTVTTLQTKSKDEVLFFFITAVFCISFSRYKFP